MNNLTPHQVAKKYIDPNYAKLTVKDQAKLLGISRSSVYYQLQEVDPETLDIMNRIESILILPFMEPERLLDKSPWTLRLQQA